jgi:PAS domain S-box-containing protein
MTASKEKVKQKRTTSSLKRAAAVSIKRVKKTPADKLLNNKTIKNKVDYFASFPELNINPILEFDRKGKLIYQNPASEKYFPDLAQLGLKHPFLADWGKITKKLLAGNLLRPLVIHIKVGDLYFEQACFAVGKNRIRVYARNITKRKIAEQALQTSEQNFRNSIDSSSMGILISDGQGHIFYANQALLEIFGYRNIAEINAKPTREFYTPESKAEAVKRVNKLANGKPIPDKIEVDILSTTGTIRHFEVFHKEVIWDGKQRHQTIYNDITERQQLITKIYELNNIMQLVTNINQLIVKIDDEKELLQKACDQFVEKRQYLLAWVGDIQENSYDISPNVKAGEKVSYLSMVRTTWDNSRWGQGPTGIAVKTGKPCAMQDLLNNPHYKPWKAAAFKMGFRASAAFPLTIGNKTTGVLNIYAASENAFDEKELTLLTELAGDLSLGIEKIRSRMEQRKLAEVLLEKEKRLAEAQEMAHLGYWYWDLKTGAVNWSDEVFKIFQLNPQKFTPQIDSILALSPWTEDHQRNQELIKRATDSHQPGSYEQKFLRPDKSIGYYYSNFQGNYDADGNLISIIGTILDITARKQAEQALKASEQNFRNSIDSSMMGIRIIDAKWNTLYVNQVFLDIFGYASIDEVGPNPLQTHNTPEEQALFLQRMEKRARGEKVPANIEVNITRDDGSIRNLQVFLKKVFWDGKQQRQLIYNDVTERKQAEKAWKASELNFRNSLDSSLMGIRIVTADRKTLYANQEFLKIFGYEDINEIGAYPLQDHYTPAERARFRTRDEQRSRGEPIPDNLQVEIMGKDGAIHYIETHSSEVLWDGKLQHEVIYKDVTESKLAQEALKLSEQNFRNSMDSSFMGIRIIDIEGHILYSNHAFLDIFGYKTIDEAITDPPRKNFIPASYADFLSRVEKIKRGEPVPDTMEVDVIRKDGALRHLQLFYKDVFWNGKQQYQTLYYDLTERKQAEKALKASEEKYSVLIEQSSDGIVLLDGFSIIFANQKIIEMSGYSQSEIIGKQFIELVAPEYHELLINSYQRVLAPAEPNTLELGIMNKDDKKITADTRALPIMYRNRPATMVIIRDVTDWKKAEEALKASEQNFRNSMDNSIIGIRISDINETNLYANQALLDIFGYKNADEIKVNPPQNYYSPQAYADWVVRHEKLKRGEPMPKQLEIDIVRKDGTTRNLQVSLNEVFWDGKQRYQTLYNDITELKLAEKAQRESEAKFRMIVENTRDMIFTINLRREYVYVSPSFHTMLGYKPDELVGKPFISLVHPDDVAIIEKEVQLSTMSGYKNSGDAEYRIRNAAGEWRWIVSRGTRFSDISGNFLYFIGIARDITEQKQAEQEKRRLEEKAQITSRLAAVGEMAAGIAHEINNPLTGVLGFAELIMEKDDIPDDIRENLMMIADGSQRVANIVKRLLTFARQSKPVKTLANLNELIETTLKLREYVLKTNSINVVTRFDPELPWSVIDPGQLQQVFLNLIVNAEQAMKKAHGRGTLTITTEKLDNMLRLSFQDDGPGITKENMRHVFEPFFTTKAPGEGTGLGLSLSRSIVLEHDGEMSVESEVGKGATFIVELPMVEALSAEEETATPTPEVKPLAAQNNKILVVDDEPTIRELLEKVLTRMGHKVDVTADAGTAMDKIYAGEAYDLIITDVRMPGMNGIELYSRILEKSPEMKNRTIFITGDVMGIDIRTFLIQNKLPYIAKPFDIVLLKEKINAILGESPGNDTATQ